MSKLNRFSPEVRLPASWRARVNEQVRTEDMRLEHCFQDVFGNTQGSPAQLATGLPMQPAPRSVAPN